MESAFWQRVFAEFFSGEGHVPLQALFKPLLRLVHSVTRQREEGVPNTRLSRHQQFHCFLFLLQKILHVIQEILSNKSELGVTQRLNFILHAPAM